MNSRLLVLIIAFLLSACGGGSKSNTSSTSTTGTSGSLSLSGVASKGLLSNAEVQSYEVLPDGTLRAIGSKKITDENGFYEITDLPTTTYPVIIKVTTTSSTTMLDESLPLDGGKFRRSIDQIKAGTEIRSMLPSLTSNSEAHIQPFTEMGVAAAESTGKLSSESMASARSIIVDSFGFDPFNTKPVNANEAMSADQEKLMAMLTGVALNAHALASGCAGDSSGVSCAINGLKSAAAIEKDGAGAYKIKNNDSIKAKLNEIKTEVANSTSSDGFLAQARSKVNTYIVPDTPAPVKPAEALQRAGLEAFLTNIRNGFHTAEETINKRTDAAQKRVEDLIFDASSDGIDTLNSVGSQCRVSADGILVCTGDGFTKTRDGVYEFQYNSADNVYVYKGNASASLDNAGNMTLNLVSAKTRNSILVEEINLAANGIGIKDQSTNGRLTLASLIVKLYDNTKTPVKYAQVNLSGLSLAGERKNDRDVITATAPVTISTSDGDSISGNITNLELVSINANPTQETYGTKLAASLDLKSKEGNVVSLKVNADHDLTSFKPWLARSATNIPKDSLSIDAKLADNVTVGLSFGQNTQNKAVMSLKISSNKNWINVAANLDSDAGGDLKVDSDGLTITSSGVYNIKIKKDTSGEFQGNLYENTTKIGEVKNGIIYVGSATSGKKISLK